jgi:hypothetical protein
MEWQEILKHKKQIKYFSTQKVDKGLIVDIIEELHLYCPSKQNETPYTITVVPNKDNKKLKKQIFYNSWCQNKGINDVRNTQVLAPYTLLFKSTTNERIGYIEIGIASTFIAYAAVSRGLAIGFCECYKGKDADLTLGIGYPCDGDTYFNPLLNKEVDKMLEGPEQPKQDKSNYIIWK